MKYANVNAGNLGTLEIVDVYEYYDRPLLYVAKTPSNTLPSKLFVGMMLSDDDSIERYGYVEIDEGIKQLIDDGQIDIRTVYLENKLHCYVVDKDKHGEISFYRRVRANEIETYMPERGVFFIDKLDKASKMSEDQNEPTVAEVSSDNFVLSWYSKKVTIRFDGKEDMVLVMSHAGVLAMEESLRRYVISGAGDGLVTAEAHDRVHTFRYAKYISHDVLRDGME